VTVGYVLMLIAMTYSVELFCMVISGLTVGFGVFQAAPGISSDRSEDDKKISDNVTTEMCCPVDSDYDALLDSQEKK
jgi:hypothetical protein